MHRLIIFFAILAVSTHSQSQMVAEDAWSIAPLMPGAAAPEFTATAHDGSEFHFDPENRDKPAIIIFYRGGWCPYCNLHFAELRAAEEQLLSLNMDLVFLSADSPETLAAAQNSDSEMKYHLLSDNSTRIAQSFGIAFQVPKEYVARLKQYDINLEKASGYDHQVLPVPGVFIVADGKIAFSYVNPDYKVRLHPDVLIAAARTMPGRVLAP